MSILERGLSKLTLEAFSHADGSGRIGALSVMYNPQSVALSYRAEYQPQTNLSSHEERSNYGHVRPGGLSLELVLDARGPAERRPVDEQLRTLRGLCFALSDKEKAQPAYLRVSWGKMNWHGHGYFAGRATSLSVSYSLFDRNAAPLRATAHLQLIADSSMTVQEELSEQAPRQMVVRSSLHDTLPLLAAGAAAVGLSQFDYLSLGYTNDLDQISVVSPGQALLMRKSSASDDAGDAGDAGNRDAGDAGGDDVGDRN